MTTGQTDHRTDPVQEWGPEFGDVIAVVQSRAVSIEDAWAVLAAARPAIEREAKAERDALAARLAAVEALADGPTSDGYRPYAVIIGTETHLDVLLDDLRAALATGTDQ